jgi:hypothetical protein
MLLRNIWRKGEILFFGCQGWLSRDGDGRMILKWILGTHVVRHEVDLTGTG